MRAALIGLAVNLCLGFVKLIGGIAGGSFALLSDAVNSLGDSVASFFVVVAIAIAQQPADREHPYGHTRAEAIAASNVALLIVASGLLMGWEAIRRIAAPGEQLPAVATLWIAAANVAIKETLYRYKLRVGNQTGSMAMVANAWDHRSDALCSLAVFIGLSLVLVGGNQFQWADPVAGLLVVTLIVLSGIKLFRQSASELMDLQAAPELIQQIRAAAEAVAGVREVEKLRVRKSGLEYFADMHIQVDAQMTVDEGHRIGHVVKDELLAQFPPLRDVLIHLEPHPHSHAPQQEA